MLISFAQARAVVIVKLGAGSQPAKHMLRYSIAEVPIQNILLSITYTRTADDSRPIH